MTTGTQPSDLGDPVDDELAGQVAHLIQSMNDLYPDATLFVARVLGGVDEPTSAVVAGIDRGGTDLLVRGPGGDQQVRLDFAEPITDPVQVSVRLFELVTRARQRSGEAGQTSAEAAMAALTTIRTFVTSVVAVADVHPHLRRITFGGGDLATFAPLGPDTFLYVLLPPVGASELTIDQSFSWTGYEQMAPEERPVGAYYTLRAWRPEVAELDVLFVLHGDGTDEGGPASAWAARARPGDPVALWGPRTSYAPPAGTDHVLLVADETGLPAAARILEDLPAGVRATVVAEAPGPAERQELPGGELIEVVWCDRGPAEPGTTTLLADAVRALPPPASVGAYAWGGAESHTMTQVRRYLRDEVGLTREQVTMVAYWRHTDHAPDPGDDEG